MVDDCECEADSVSLTEGGATGCLDDCVPPALAVEPALEYAEVPAELLLAEVVVVALGFTDTELEEVAGGLLLFSFCTHTRTHTHTSLYNVQFMYTCTKCIYTCTYMHIFVNECTKFNVHVHMKMYKRTGVTSSSS